MFTHNVSVGKTRVLGRAVSQRMRSILVFVLALVMGALSLAGCKNDPDDTGNLIGTWTSTGGDGYTITGTTVTYTSGMDPLMSFAGTIKNSPNFAAPYGVIIIEYTTPVHYYASYDPNPPYAGISPYEPTNHFQGIYWKDLTATSVGLANAYKSPEPEEATLPAAQSAFTLDNEPTYVYSYASLSKN
ncbi:MAG: hypothetical protein LBN21_07765 [Treponema sp.]|jgi:hypothetical protein|nr:hypothetical protein [Treponema sp.]